MNSKDNVTKIFEDCLAHSTPFVPSSGIFDTREEGKEKHLRSYNVEDFLRLDIPPRRMILDPIIPEQGLVMLYAPRGIGKTHIALSIAYTIASGASMFEGKWQCEEGHKVLFVDGEMPATALIERTSHLIEGADYELTNADYLKIITPDLQELSIPDLSTSQGQQCIEEHLEDIDLIILDNLSSLSRSGRENESESWTPLQSWFLKLRSRGKSVLIVHHAGKNGHQRGTSKKEDLLDTIISLRRPDDYDPEQGARFEVHYEKARGFYGEQAKPFEACLTQEDGKSFWRTRDLEDCKQRKIIQLHAEGFTQREISGELGIGVATVNRHLKRAKGEGNKS